MDDLVLWVVARIQSARSVAYARFRAATSLSLRMRCRIGRKRNPAVRVPIDPRPLPPAATGPRAPHRQDFLDGLLALFSQWRNPPREAALPTQLPGLAAYPVPARSNPSWARKGRPTSLSFPPKVAMPLAGGNPAPWPFKRGSRLLFATSTDSILRSDWLIQTRDLLL